MTAGDWQLLSHTDPAALPSRFATVFQAVYRDHFAGQMGVNDRLPVEAGEAASPEVGWWAFRLLTPWMLTEVLVPTAEPDTDLPPGWSAAERDAAPFTLLGPTLPAPSLGPPLPAHLTFHPELGHFLLRPLVQSLEGYRDAAAVYAAWEEVVAFRQQAQKAQAEAAAQREVPVSRRDFFRRLGGRG
jgi:hypothetical protein